MPIANFVLVTAIFNLTLSFYIWKTKYKEPLNIAFGIFGLFIGFWVLLNYFFIKNPNIFFLNTIYAIGPFIIISGFQWVNLLKNKHLTNRFIWFLFILYSISIFFVVLMFSSNQMITSVSSALKYSTGSFFNYYTIFMSILLFGFVGYIIYQYVFSNKELRKSFLLIGTGMILVVLIAAIAGIILPSLGLSEYNFLDSPSTIFFVALASYAVIKHQLMDIKVAITEIIVYFLIIILFATLFIYDQSISILSKSILMLLIGYGGYQLIKSVKLEIQRREEIEELSEELKESNKKLKKLDAMKTEFVSVASHELLTPISAIKGYLSMILDEKIVDIKNAKAEDYLDRVYMSAKRLSKLVKDLLNVSRIEQGRLSFKKVKFDPNKLMDSVKKELKFKARDVNTEIKIVEDIDVRGYGDTDKLKEVLINLVGNSIKFTLKNGKIELKAEVWNSDKIRKRHKKTTDFGKKTKEQDKDYLPVHMRDIDIVGDKQIVFSVKDNGIGMEESDMKKLFGKFSRLDNWQQHHIQGTGLGLYISKTLILMHYGRIWAESKGKDQGTTFFFSVPLEKQKDKINKLDQYIPQTKDAKPLAKINKEEM